MRFIIIRGKIKSGKTTTCAILYERLIKLAHKEHVFNGHKVSGNCLNGNVVDFSAVFTIKNLKVGILSTTDTPKYLKPSIEAMQVINVDVLVCCARRSEWRGSTYKFISDNYKQKIVLEVWPDYIDGSKSITEIKTPAVNTIVNVLKEII